MVERGTPDHIRSDNGPEFTAKVIRGWLGRLGVRTLFIEPGSPWENGYIESFNGKLRDELLNREIFDTLLEAQVIIEKMEKGVQHQKTAQFLELQAPGTGGDFCRFRSHGIITDCDNLRPVQSH
jgi:Integrase core domain.